MAMPIRRLPWNIPEPLVVVGDVRGIRKRAERWGGVRLTRGGLKGAGDRVKRARGVTLTPDCSSYYKSQNTLLVAIYLSFHSECYSKYSLIFDGQDQMPTLWEV